MSGALREPPLTLRAAAGYHEGRSAAPRIITASRRTDLPAFYSRWLLRRLKDGFCHVLNPYNGRVQRVGLLPEDVLALALFTRDPSPLLPELPALLAEGYKVYAHVTIACYPRDLEPFTPDQGRAVASFRCLAEVLGPDLTVWRYDPIILGDHLTSGWHRARFTQLARALKGSTSCCYVSFAAPYRKTLRRLERVAGTTGQKTYWPGTDEQHALAGELLEIATPNDITLHACACQELLGAGLARGRCVDAAMVTALRSGHVPPLKSAPTRTGCGCCAATDIGAFDTCVHGCEYCYATASQAVGQARLREHDPQDTILWRPPRLRGVDLDHLERPAGRGPGAGKDPGQGELFTYL